MGTNFYFYEKPPCESCGRKYEPIHIGKSSAGWCFSLHVYPDDGIHTLEDWRHKLDLPGSYIKDEYGRDVTVLEMLDTITDRGRDKPPDGFDFTRNQAEPGPNNLIRHKVDGVHCVGHGIGTWVHMIGNFS